MLQELNTASVAKKTFHSLVTWGWTKKLLHWLIISAGTVSECAFLIASIWMSINASVHPLVLLFMNEQASEHISELATAAYVALPELILGLAFVVTIGHVRLWLYDRENYTAAIWVVLYGLPTLIFLVLSLVTLGCSVISVNFRMPELLIVVRALAGYMFAFTSLLYTQLGVPQEKDRLQQKDNALAELRQQNAVNLNRLHQNKDAMLAALRQEKDAMLAALGQNKDATIAELRKDSERLNAIIEEHTREIENQKALIEHHKNIERELLNTVKKSDEDALQAYSDECQNWLKSGVKTVSLEEITRYTGHSKRKIEGAITKGLLQTAPRNKELILVSSLTNWLRTAPLSTGRAEEIPVLHVVNG